MAARIRSRQQREHDLERISELVLRGLTQRQIAAELGVCQQQVTYDLRIVEKRWQAAQVINFEARRQRLVAELELQRRELWAAWERSKRERKSTTTRQRKLPAASPAWEQVPPDGMPVVVAPPGADGHVLGDRVEREARVRVEERDADVRYQMALTKVIELQAQLEGLLDQTPAPGGQDEPVQRIVVYMEPPLGGHGDDQPAAGVIEVGPGALPAALDGSVEAPAQRA